MSTLTRQQALDLFIYNPFTGEFRNRVNRGTRARAGDIAGGTYVNGYLVVGVNGHLYLVHRVIHLMMTGRWPEETDHKNHIRDDNRWKNLREVNNQENGKNHTMQKNNTSGFVGVHWNKRAQMWWARIKVNQKEVYLGSFTNKDDAIKARAAADIKYGFHANHGEAKAVQYAH